MQVLAETKSLFHALYTFYKEIKKDIDDCCLFTEFYKPDEAFAVLSKSCEKPSKAPVSMIKYFTILFLGMIALIFILNFSELQANHNKVVSEGLVWWWALIILGFMYAIFAWMLLAGLRMSVVLFWALANKISSK